MEGSTFWQQLVALLKRNYLIKKRNKKLLFGEFEFPLVLVGILVLAKLTLSSLLSQSYPELTFPSRSLDFFDVPNSCDEIYGSPKSAQDWILKISEKLKNIPSFKMFDSEELAETEYEKIHRKSKKTICGVSFNVTGNKYSYKIRLNYEAIPSTSDKHLGTPKGCNNNVSQNYDECKVNNYLQSGFVHLQLAIENTLLKSVGGFNSNLLPDVKSVRLKMMDKEGFTSSSIMTVILQFFCVVGVMVFNTFCSDLCINIVTEKEKKIKEGMLMMGLRSSVLWLSWAIIYAVLIVGLSGIIVVIFAIFSFYQRSNFFLLFIGFSLYGFTTITFSFMVTPFFNNPKNAGAVASIFLTILGVLPIVLNQITDSMSPTVLFLVSLISPCAFFIFLEQGMSLDIYKDGFGFDESLSYGKSPLYVPILMLLFDTFLYSCLTVYLEHVLPKEYGTLYPPYYFLMPSYWYTKNKQTSVNLDLKRSLTNNINIEPVSPEVQETVGIRILDITKEFTNKKNRAKAVSNFNLDIYQNQITCLLGHNGAGKTTLLNILTGIVPPSSGTAYVMGKDITITCELEKLRTQYGICLQENILYDELSCREHLDLFADIKGVQTSDIERIVEKSLKDVELEDKKEMFTKHLSGGEKRKLSVAIALIGNPKVIFLDEPTAGMSPNARRQLWSFLKQKKEGRVILLTTHFMDEADILADRKAFIRKGNLQCCGSSLFLKNRFGIGYHLNMVVDLSSDLLTIENALQSKIPEIVHERSHGKQLSFTVPLEQTSKFGSLFSYLDEKENELGIKSYGVSMTTLEEVFLKLEETNEQDDNFFVNEVNVNIDQIDKETIFKSLSSGNELTKQILWALLKIRFFLWLRSDRAILVLQTIFPFCLISFALILDKTLTSTPLEKPGPLLLQPDLYNSTVLPNFPNSSNFLMFYNKESSDQKNVKNYFRMEKNEEYQTGSVKTGDVQPHFLGMQINNVTSDLTNKYLKGYTILYNDSAIHSIPIIMSMASQSFLNAANKSLEFELISHPWPQIFQKDVFVLDFWIFFGIAFTFPILFFAVGVVQDREIKLRSQLRISGVKFDMYWGTIFMMDLAICLIPGSSFFILMFAFGVEGYTNLGVSGIFLLLFITNIPLNVVAYILLSFLFNATETCLSLLPAAFSLQVVICQIVLNWAIPTYGVIVHYFFCVLNPFYLIFGGLYFTNSVIKMEQRTGIPAERSDYFQHEVLICVIMPVFHMIWMYFLMRVLDVKKSGGRIKEAFPWIHEIQVTTTNADVDEYEDKDVKDERRKVDALVDNTGAGETPVAFVSELRKTFPQRTGNTKVAVKNLNFIVGHGEILGLLGPNGAGKSSTLSMITGEVSPTCGKVVINGKNVRSNIFHMDFAGSLGYCPQYDALWGTITLKEHIQCYAVIKGISPKNLDSVTNHYIASLNLQEHQNKRSKILSGGTKRKLCYIISLLGSPKLVLLDEPTTGMDPKSKRYLWDTMISSFKDTDKGAILTTHYMEEADALCDRVGIMVNGQLQCLGPPQHLKNRFGADYILDLKLKIDSEKNTNEINSKMDALEVHLKTYFPHMVTVERFSERAQYSVSKRDVRSLGRTFSCLEMCKVDYGLEEYSFSQSTLEQVFLFFAKQQDVNERQGTSSTAYRNEDSPVITPAVSSKLWSMNTAEQEEVDLSMSNTVTHTPEEEQTFLSE